MHALANFLLQANFFPIRHIVVNRAERKSSEVGSWDQEAAEKSASSPPFSGGNSTPLTPIGRSAGACPLLVGIVLNLWSARLFKQQRTTIKPFQRSETIVAKGPYRWSRNPMYLGMSLVLLGIALLLGSTTPMLIIPVFIGIISVRFIAVEERMLTDRFGPTYEEYCKRVRRWL